MDAELPDPLGIGQVDDVSVAARMYIYGHHRVLFFSSIACAVALAIPLALVMWAVYQTNPLGFDARSIIIPLLPALIPVGVYSCLVSRVQREFLQQMAHAIGYTYSESAPIDTVSGQMFSTGHSQSLKDVMSGTYKDHPARLFNLSYTVGYGKNAHTYTSTVFELAYPTPLPHIILNLNPDESVPSDVEVVELEGDFNKYFSLYVTKGAQMEIREIFQPDTMQELLKGFQIMRMEIYGTKVYISRSAMMTGKRQEFLYMQQMMDTVFDLLLPNLRGVSQDTVAAQSVAHQQ